MSGDPTELEFIRNCANFLIDGPSKCILAKLQVFVSRNGKLKKLKNPSYYVETVYLL